jgi:hypothetical protein
MNDQKRKPGQKLKTGKIKGEILKYALKHGGMFEEPTLKDAIEEAFKIRRGTVKKKHLDVLKAKGFLSKKEEPGHPNIWRIKEDRKTILLIYTEYPQLIPYLQRSDFVLNCIAKEQSSLFENKKALKELKKMMTLSLRMFESCLKIDDFKNRHDINQLVFGRGPSPDLSERAYMYKHKKSPSKEIKIDDFIDVNAAAESAIKTHLARWDLFLSCIKTDVDDSLSSNKKNRINRGLIDMIVKENEKRADANEFYVEAIRREAEGRVKKEVRQ